MVSLRRPPTFMPGMPCCQPWMTWSRENWAALPRDHEESNSLPEAAPMPTYCADTPTHTAPERATFPVLGIAGQPDVRSGKDAITVGTNDPTLRELEGMGVVEGRALLARLQDWAVQPAFTYQHRWRPNDCLLWDNHAVMHYAPADYDFRHPELPGNRRVMHRTTFAGQAPIPA